MTGRNEHAAAVWTLVDGEPVHPDDEPSSVGRLQRLCRVASRDLPASGVGLSVMSGGGDLVTAAASSEASMRVEDLQFALGEGPCLDAFSAAGPVLVPDLLLAANWPGYAPAAHGLGVRAVFAFPMQVGVTQLGVLDVYREQPGSLSGWALTRAETYATAAAHTIAHGDHDGEELAELVTDGSAARLEVYQAQGMVMVQLGVGPDEAMARLKAHAFAEDRPLVDLAADIIARRLVLESDVHEE